MPHQLTFIRKSVNLFMPQVCLCTKFKSAHTLSNISNTNVIQSALKRPGSMLSKNEIMFQLVRGFQYPQRRQT